MRMVTEIDHSVVAVNDLVLAERFYGEILTQVLGGYLEGTSAHTTEELVRSRQRRELMAQGFGQDGRGGGGGPHSSVRLGEALVAIFLHTEHVQEPPPEQLRGVPRLSFFVTPAQMEKAREVFRRHRIAHEEVEHPSTSPLARSLFFKDPSSNFLEVCCAR